MTGIETTGRVRVLVVAAYPTTRAGLKAVIEGDPAFEVAGEAGNLDALIAQLEGLAPDVILLDPGADIDSLLEGLESLSSGGLLPPLVLISPAIDSVADVIAVGIQGFLLPDASAEEIGAALRSALAGLTAIDSRAVASLLERRTLPESAPEPEGRYQALTPREAEVLQLIAQGLPNKTIAIELGISEHTVKFHVGSILTKLDAASRAEALARAARVGLIVL